ncbi:MAG: hypothetical protein V4594_05660, partial [Bacteroidota bacterium]
TPALWSFPYMIKNLDTLVCMIHEEMVVIRTFLFITNDGTPEGKKLSELTRVQLLDKQFLGIDTLAGFIKFRVADDPILKALFKEADCESLLDLTVLEKFLVSDVTVKDPSVLLNYLRGIADSGSSENNLAEMLPQTKIHI